MSKRTSDMNHLRANQKEAYKAARDAGLSDQAAKVMTACFTGESLAMPWLRRWDLVHYSQGIAQWDQNRAERIRAHFGKYPKDMSVTDQVKAFLWECERHYPKTYHALHSNISPEEQMLVMVRDFERPRNPARDIKTRMKYYAALDKISGDTSAADGKKPKPPRIPSA